jgi:hypothetical protein
MARPTLLYALDYVARLIGESVELLEEVVRNSDNIDDGEMINVSDGTEQGIIAFTDRGIENLHEFLADVRLQVGGIHQFLMDSQCDPEAIQRIMVDAPNP